jgi:hypothetical protein
MTEILKTTRQLLPFLVALFSLILHVVHGHGELTVPQSRNNFYKYVVNASLEIVPTSPRFLNSHPPRCHPLFNPPPETNLMEYMEDAPTVFLLVVLILLVTTMYTVSNHFLHRRQ